jgi:sulfur carrier protein ThiS
MPVRVMINKENTEELINISHKISVKQLLDKLNINPVTVIVSKDKEILTEEDSVGQNDEIKLISVISGG